MIKIDFEFETKYGKFADAISFDPSITPMTDDEIEAEKQRRLTNWLSFIEAPSVEEI